MSYEMESLSIGEIKGTFFRQAQPSRWISVIYPGWGYSCEMPLLYYTTNLLLELGSDVLHVETNYSRRNIPIDEKLPARVKSDAEAGLKTALAQNEYERVTLIGKSVGTRALASLVDQLPSGSDLLWLTPIFNAPEVFGAMKQTAGRSLIVAGSADSYFDATAARTLEGAGARMLVLENADHSLDLDHDTAASVLGMHRYLTRARAFLASG